MAEAGLLVQHHPKMQPRGKQGLQIDRPFYLYTILISNVVSIGAFPAIKFIFTPLEYIPTIPPLSSYVINVCYKKEKKT